MQISSDFTSGVSERVTKIIYTLNENRLRDLQWSLLPEHQGNDVVDDIRDHQKGFRIVDVMDTVVSNFNDILVCIGDKDPGRDRLEELHEFVEDPLGFDAIYAVERMRCVDWRTHRALRLLALKEILSDV